MMYRWDFGAVLPYIDVLLYGLWTTLWLSALVVAVGTPVGFILGLFLQRGPARARWLAALAVDIVRALPLLVLILLFYYTLPSVLFGMDLPAVWVGWAALTIYLIAFVGDVVRGAAQALPEGPSTAARALGMSRLQTIQHVEFPWLFRAVLPTLSLAWIGMLKNSSLVSVIGVYELTHSASLVVNNTFRSIETYSTVAGMYLIVVVPLAMAARFLERRIDNRARGQ